MGLYGHTILMGDKSQPMNLRTGGLVIGHAWNIRDGSGTLYTATADEAQARRTLARGVCQQHSAGASYRLTLNPSKTMKLQIKNRWTGELIVEGDFSSLAKLVEDCVRKKLSLRAADLRDANLSAANLSVIRDDVWAVLSSNPSEVKTLLATLEAGKVDGSTYDGACACLSGTLANSCRFSGHEFDASCRNSSRPAERFFLNIRIGDKPENSQSAKIAHGWIKDWLNRMETAFGKEAA